jgi:hypothetical protein
VTIGELADSETQPVAIAMVAVITKVIRNLDPNIVTPLKGGCQNSILAIQFSPWLFTNCSLKKHSET